MLRKYPIDQKAYLGCCYKIVLLITRMNKIKNISILCYVKGVLKVIEQ